MPVRYLTKRGVQLHLTRLRRVLLWLSAGIAALVCLLLPFARPDKQPKLVLVPLGFATLAAIYYTACRLIVRRDDLPAERCVRCGYDLRASPGRCPECGAGR